MVLISNVIFTFSELILLGYFFKEISRQCETNAYRLKTTFTSSVPLGPVDLNTPNGPVTTINQNLCTGIFYPPKGGRPIMGTPAQVLYVDQSAKKGPQQVYHLGCYEYRSLIDHSNNLFGWEVIEGDPGTQRVSAVFGNSDFPDIYCGGWVAFRDE